MFVVVYIVFYVRLVSSVLSFIKKKKKKVTSMQMMHVTDWLPTIVNLAQGKITKEIDGFDQWKTLQGDVESPRKEILLNIDHLVNSQEGLIVGDWKILIENCKKVLTLLGS